MKLICLDKNTFMLLTLILRQFGLSVFRSGSDTRRITQFFEENKEFYLLLEKKLKKTVIRNKLEINRTDDILIKFPNKIFNIFIKKTCFYKSDFHQIIRIYFSGFEILHSKKIEQNKKWMMLGQGLMTYSDFLIDSKLSNKERKIVNRVEHFDQNEMFDNTSYSIEEALKLLTK